MLLSPFFLFFLFFCVVCCCCFVIIRIEFEFNPVENNEIKESKKGLREFWRIAWIEVMERKECGWTVFSLLQMVVLKCWFVLFHFVFMVWVWVEDQMKWNNIKIQFRWIEEIMNPHTIWTQEKKEKKKQYIQSKEWTICNS